jgi:flagellar basal body-associated protein FliL
MDNFNHYNSNANQSNTPPKQGKTILIVIAVIFIVLIGGGLIFG